MITSLNYKADLKGVGHTNLDEVPRPCYDLVNTHLKLRRGLFGISYHSDFVMRLQHVLLQIHAVDLSANLTVNSLPNII